MIDQSKLLECMEEIKKIAVSQQGYLTKEEINQYLNDMELDESQMEAVYQYLCANHITVAGYDYVSSETEMPEEQDSLEEPETVSEISKGKMQQEAEHVNTKAQRNLKIYQQEVLALKSRTGQQETELIKRFLNGETQLRDEILHGQLEKVIHIARTYQKRGVVLEEIIAEGNMGLMNAMVVLEQNRESFRNPEGEPDIDKVYSALELEIRQAMERMIDETMDNRDWEETIVARTNLLHEAAKYLAQELGRAATQEELSEYTRIPLEEIRDIMGISEEVRKAF